VVQSNTSPPPSRLGKKPERAIRQQFVEETRLEFDRRPVGCMGQIK
jgi:hypothetical protein